MADRRSYVLVALAVFAVGLATRAVPLYWSPLPATLDGLRYASLATDAIAGGHLPLSRLDADELVFTTVLSAASVVTGRAPLRLAQPLVTITGAASGLVAVALVRRGGEDEGRVLSYRRLRIGAAAAGLALALDGIFLRRTGVPDEEAFGLLLVPLVAIAVHRFLRSRRPGWGAVGVVLLIVLPPLHNLSAVVGALTITALVAAEGGRADDRPFVGLVLGTVVAVGFWGYFFGFFRAAGRLGLTITYGEVLGAYPGLVLAWVVVLVVGVAWFRRTGPAMQRFAVALPIVVSLGVVTANAVTPVYPGTIATPPAVMGMLLGFVVPVAFGTVAAPLLSSNRRTGPLLLALLAGPVILIGYILTGSLTPAFFSAVMRVQTFGHLPVFVLAGLAVGRVLPTSRLSPAGAQSQSSERSPSWSSERSPSWSSERSPSWSSERSPSRSSERSPAPSSERSSARSAASSSSESSDSVPAVGPPVLVAVGLLLAGTAVTAPLAYVDLNTVSYPSTVTPGEFRAAAFATSHVESAYASDRNQARIAGNYFGGTASTVVGPTRSWLAGGPRPDCPVLSRRSWTTTGAYFYPAGPRTLATNAYDAVLARRHLVYTSNGLENFALTRPPDDGVGC